MSQLRQQGLTPANVYGTNLDSEAVAVDALTFKKLYEEVGETGVIYLSIDENATPVPVLIGEVQYHPVTGDLLHISFKRVDLSEKITAEIPVETIGENTVPGTVVVVVKDVIEVEALPTDLPESFEVDISVLTEAGQSITYSGLKYDTAQVTLLIEPEEFENPIVLLEELREEVEPEPTESETEAAGEEAAAETPDAGAAEKSDENKKAE